jgi:hypothetical protein
MEKSTETLYIYNSGDSKHVTGVRWPDLKNNLLQFPLVLILSSQLDWKPSSN